MKVGILALQGDFEKHRNCISRLGQKSILIKSAKDLDAASHLIIPGGESTALLKLLDQELKDNLCLRIQNGLPTLATCAGLILLADRVENPYQESLHLLQVEVKRNAYGRQKESFICSDLSFSEEAKEKLKEIDLEQKIEAVFIRAPQISKLSSNVSPLIYHKDKAVFVKQDNILAASFHPELSDSNTIHQLFLSLT